MKQKLKTMMPAPFSLLLNMLFPKASGIHFLPILMSIFFTAGAVRGEALRSAAEPDYPPLSVASENGMATGFSVELLKAISRAVNLDVSFKSAPWAQIKEELANGELDMLPLVGRTPEREPLFDFTIPYLTLHGALFIRKDEQNIHSLADLPGKQIAVMKEDNAEEYVLRKHLSDRIIRTETFQDAFRLLSAGKADAVIAQKLMGISLLEELNIKNVTIVGKPNEEFKQDFCIAVRENNKQLLSMLNEGLAIVMADGTLQELKQKWLGIPKYNAEKARTLVYFGDQAYPPYEFINEKGEPDGFNIDLAQSLAKRVGMDISFNLLPWTQVRQKISSREQDLAAMLYSEERDKEVDFLIPHAFSPETVFANKNSPSWPGKDQLKNFKIAVQSGDLSHDYAIKNGFTNLIVTATPEEALQLLVNSQVDFSLCSMLQGQFWINKNGWKNLFPIKPELFTTEYGFVVPEGRTDLLNLLNAGLLHLKNTGEYRKIYNKWLAPLQPNADWIRIRKYIFTAVPVIALLGLIAAIWISTLQYQVKKQTAALKESKERLNIATRAGGIGVWDLDLTNNRLIWDNQMHELYKIGRKDFCGTYEAWEKCIHPDDLQHAEERLTEAIQGKNRMDFEFRIVHPNNSFRWIRALGEIIRDSHENPKRMIGTNQDITDRKINEELVRNSEAHFRSLLENIPDLVWLKDPSGIYLHCNRRFEALYGAMEKTIKGKTDYDFVSKEQAGFFRDHDRKAIENKGPTKNNEWVTFASDGHRELLETVKTPLYAEDGSLTGVLGIGRNITERVESEQRFSMLFEKIQTGVAIYRPVEDNLNFVFVDMNPAGLKFGQVSRDEIVGRKVTDIFPGLEKSGLLDVFRNVARNGSPKHYPLIQYQDERIKQWVENDVFKLPSGLIVAVFDDTTEKHKAEEQIRLQAAVLDQIQDFVTITDLDGIITYVNQAEEKLFGCNASELIGKSVETYGDDPDRNISQKELIRRTIQDGQWRGEISNKLPDGQMVLMDCRTQLIYDAEGKPMGISGISTDITAQKTIQEELKKHNAELEQFNRMATGRELRMIELKKEINALCRELGRQEPYA